MSGLIEELKLHKVAYLLEKLEKKDFDTKISALRKLEKMKITPNIGLFLIENSIRNYGINDTSGGVNSTILSLCFKEYYDVYTSAIEKIYDKLDESIQKKIVFLLTTVDSESALNLYVKLVLKDYKNSDFIPISNLFERPYLYNCLFPKLFNALKFNSIKNNILILLNDYLNAGVVPIDDIKKNKKVITDAILRVFNYALKNNFKNTFSSLNNEEYIDIRFFLEICINIEYYVSNKKTKEALEKLLKKKDNQLKLFILENYYRKNIKFDEKCIYQISKDPLSRYPLYEMLFIYNKTDLMKDKFKTIEALSESDFYINFCIYCNYKEEPKNIKLVDKITVNNYDYYIYKFTISYIYDSSNEYLTNYIFNMVGMEKYNGKKVTNDFIGISGGYDKDGKIKTIIHKHSKLLFSQINDETNIKELAYSLINEEEKKMPKVKEKIEKREDTKKKLSVFTIILLLLLVIFIILCICCIVFANNIGNIGNKLNKNIISSVKLNSNCNYTFINGKDVYNENESEYYVLFFKNNDEKNKYYNYINKYCEYNKKFYFVDLNDENNKFLYKNNDLGITLTGDRLLKVKDKEYEYYVNGKNNILSEMKKDTKSLEEQSKK